ncbi:MAG: DUF86 domain-containing protein [Deltaproteobacteria bacterium]|nr:DUF86 domain-containing protein [Deltaproteobacteria bacterium]
MKKDYLLYIEDMVFNVKAILSFVEGVSKEEFLKDMEKQYAVVRALTIIGEACKKVPQEVKEKYPSIPWREMASTRDVLIHDYDGVDLEIVWDIVTNDLPEVLPGLESCLVSA